MMSLLSSIANQSHYYIKDLKKQIAALKKENAELKQRIGLMEPIVRDARQLANMLKVNMIPVYIKTLNNNITKLDLFDAEKTGELE
jgi:hypothetical protein